MADKKHEHRWQGFRGGMTHFQMCAVCGEKKDEEVTDVAAPEPEPVEIEVEAVEPAKEKK